MSKPAAAAKDWSDVVKGAKRELLLRAARDEFAEQGLEGATMRGIAVRAGCTTGAIYPLFDSKEAIYAELLKQSLAALDAYVAEAVAAARTPEAQVEAACGAFLNYYLDHRFEINLGLYAFRGLKRLGVGKPSDEELNQALWKVLERIALPLTEVARPQAFRGSAVGGAADQPDDRGACAADRGPAGFSRNRRADAASHDAGAMPCADGFEEREGRT